MKNSRRDVKQLINRFCDVKKSDLPVWEEYLHKNGQMDFMDVNWLSND